MPTTVKPVFFACEGERLLGICHLPETASEVGVVIVVGGPQYRVGSHRQFVLLARYLAAAGIPVFRFDYRGMGDSSGSAVSFNEITPDIKAAIDTFCGQCSAVKRVVLWGLCDAASAIMIYALEKDPRVCGQILLNPWVRTDEGIARVYLKNYYARRFFDKEIWRRMLRGDFDYRKSLAEIVSVTQKVFQKKLSGKKNKKGPLHYTERMLLGSEAFTGDTLLILSGNDMTADEFRQHVAESERWKMLLQSHRFRTETLPVANHTFSKAIWRDQVTNLCSAWVGRL